MTHFESPTKLHKCQNGSVHSFLFNKLLGSLFLFVYPSHLCAGEIISKCV